MDKLQAAINELVGLKETITNKELEETIDKQIVVLNKQQFALQYKTVVFDKKREKE